MVDGVLGEAEPTPPPCRPRQDGLTGGAESGVVVADHELDAAQAARDQAVEEGAPMRLRLREGGGDAEEAAPALGVDADGGEDGAVAHHAAVADLLAPRVGDEIADLPGLARAPFLQLLVEERGVSG